MTTALEINNLNVYFGDRGALVHAVKAASLRVETGASFGLVGESGSGKSTILKAITGLAPQWNGIISVEGTRLGPTRDREFYKTVQMVFQDPYASLHPRHSVDQVLRETLYLHGFSDIDARVVKLLDDVGLGQKFRFRYPHQLSGGQRQRVAIARAIAKRPEVMLCDEPTGALDSETGILVLEALQNVNRTYGTTTIIITHNVSIADVADRVIYFADGRVSDVVKNENPKPIHEIGW